ncbi:MAG: preprotein translocase subunit SecA [Kofleriaceae bacterium]|nr:preprotein translocase subunit SecA [Myxococcales bacterium]MCB9558836.1 preprotein translocase subunit SecA [Kofleriaceae bacterium]MCB9570609.1 preprotein translocase subunit SecA [Kofleriaceae bacterium]
MGFLQKLFGSKNQREVKRMQPLVDRIGQLGATMEAKSDAELRALTGELKQRIDNGATLDDVLPEAFAAVREAGVRALGMRHYDVQLIGGMVLHSGRIAEMRTGEGKTLVATLPAYLNALSGKGVHVVTVNDYLARRDAEWMGKLYGFLGLTTGVVVHGVEDYDRQRAYRCDITYGQNNEFGFDYLRDNMKTSPDRMVQRPLNYAIVDEVDSILIDEARTPLIISGAAEQAADLYIKVDRIIPRLKRDVDYVVDEKAHNTMLTDEGVERVQKLLGVDNLYDSHNLQLNHHVVQALRAHTLYKRDVNYLVEEGKVVIVDEFTGRKMPGRRWSDGLHQAIEAKEGVTIEEENQTLATVTFQNYFRMYNKLSGMTGTADTEATEFTEIYKLDVVVIPTNKPIVRKDHPDLVYKNEKGKFRAVINDLEDCQKRGQPVLVGTVSVEKSEVLAKMLRERGLPFNVLNAKQHGREAMVVAQAGRKGSITISTNMAGRGTDILLGGNAEAMAKEALAQEKAKLAESASAAQQAPVGDGAGDGDGEPAGDGPYRGAVEPAFDEEARYAELLAMYKAQCDAERQEVMAAGGLKIVGTERHESRRIDNQLRGRAGRQGDPGASRFYLSLEDDLLRIFGLDRMAGLMERLGLEEDTPIESPMVTRSIEGAQKKVEGRNFDIRKNVLEYDDVMNQQRKTIYALRRQVLEGRYLRELSEEDVKKGVVAEPATESGTWTISGLADELRPKVVELVDRIADRVAERDRDLADGKPVGETRPHWRVLRTEIWRQYGCLLDVEKQVEGTTTDTAKKSALVTFIAERAAASLIQQRERVYDMCEELIQTLVNANCPSAESEEEWDVDALEDALAEQFNCEFDVGSKLDHEEIAANAWKTVEKRLDEREQELTRPWFMYFARHFLLEEIDNQWIDHLKNMDALREGIGLLGYGQKDPKKEYKRIGLEMFTEMMGHLSNNVATKLFRVEIKKQEEPVPTVETKEREMVEAGAAGKVDQDEAEQQQGQQRRARGERKAPRGNGAAGEPKQETVRRDRPKVGRNDPCPCGSGKKYKKCHGRDEAEAGAGGE